MRWAASAGLIAARSTPQRRDWASSAASSFRCPPLRATSRLPEVATSSGTPAQSAKCPHQVNTAAGQEGADFITLHGLEQASRPARRLRTWGAAVQHHHRAAAQPAMQGRAQPEGTRPDDRDIRLHDPAPTKPQAMALR